MFRTSPFVADLDPQRVEKHDRVGRLEWPGLPGGYLVNTLIGHGRHQIRGNIDAVQLAHVAVDVPRAHAAGVERDNLVVKARKAPPVLGNQRRIEAPVPIARNRQLHRPLGREHGLGAAAVAVVSDPGIGLIG